MAAITFYTIVSTRIVYEVLGQCHPVVTPSVTLQYMEGRVVRSLTTF